jgi:ribosomal protein L11 methyltransferase
MAMSQPIFQVTIPTSVDGAELSGLLNSPEFLGLWEEGGALTIYWQGSEGSIRRELKEALSKLNTTISNASIHLQLVRHQDWNAQWAASVKPIRIGRRIGIRPSWMTMQLPEDGIEIVLDPKQAFGTGHHATTHLLIEWLEDVSWLPDCRVLDVGTGSGILSMVALRLGAMSALGIDNDAVAIDYARAYAADNGFGKELELQCCQVNELADQVFEVILANIDRKTILEISPEFSKLRSSATQLFLSGLLEEDASEIVKQFRSQGWTQEAIREREGWIALQFRGSSSAGSSSGCDSRNIIRA